MGRFGTVKEQQIILGEVPGMTFQMSGQSWRAGLYCCLAAALCCLAAADERSHKVWPGLGTEMCMLARHAALLEPANSTVCTAARHRHIMWRCPVLCSMLLRSQCGYGSTRQGPTTSKRPVCTWRRRCWSMSVLSRRAHRSSPRACHMLMASCKAAMQSGADGHA